MRLRETIFGEAKLLNDISEPLSKTLTLLEEKPITNSSAMTASAVINTDLIDYQNEVILASGVDVTNYQRNPSVLWEHGKKDLVPFPIGQSEDEEGQFTLQKSADGYEIEATTYFSQRYPEAIQIFGLIDEGVIRATSIQVIPVEKCLMASPDGSQFKLTKTSHMVEYSWCCFGVNAEAVRKSFDVDRYLQFMELQADAANAVLERGSIGGDSLLIPIKKSLESLLPAPAPSSPGFDFETQEKAMPKRLSEAEAKKLSREELEELIQKNAGQYEADTVTLCKSLYEEVVEREGGGDDLEAALAEGAEEKGETEGDEGEMPKTHVAKAMAELHRAVKMLTEHFSQKFSDELDVAPATKSVLSVLGELDGQLLALEGAFTESYPQCKSLAEINGEAGGDAIEDDAFVAQLKSLLAAKPNTHFKTAGIVGSIRRAGEVSDLQEVRTLIGRTLPALEAIQEQAKSFTPPMPEGAVSREEHDGVVAELTKEKEGLETALAESTSALNKLTRAS